MSTTVIIVGLIACILIPLAMHLVANYQRRARLVWYARRKEPIIEHCLHENDTQVLVRCVDHIFELERSQNQIDQYIKGLKPEARKLTVIWAENENRTMYLDFVLPIIFRDGYPLETWEEYEIRLEKTRRLYLEAYHTWLRRIGEKLENNEWYVEKILAQDGAKTLSNYLTFQK